MFHVPEKYRVRHNKEIGTTQADGNNGYFVVPNPDCPNKRKLTLIVVASDGLGWEHVSVSFHDKKKTPTWRIMCYIKDLFWDEDDVVIQYHPAKDQYVNMHPHCLHLWRPVGVEFPIPTKTMVGL